VAADAGESSWDDLDSRIESTYTAIQALETQPRGMDQSLTEFENQLRQLSEEVAAESL
jgi:chaperonin cofactor prefoldin